METYNKHSEAVFAIILVPVLFSLYLIFSRSTAIRHVSGMNPGQQVRSVRLVVMQKMAGALLFTIIPLLAIFLFTGKSLSIYWLRSANLLKQLLYAAPFIFIIIPLIFFNSKTEGNLKIYPQFRLHEWGIGSILLTSLTWMVYLTAYEFLFRGYLLFSCLEVFSIPFSIFINILLYSLVHIPKGPKELLGAIPMGIVLCLLVIRLNSIWIAVIVHLILALSNEFFSISAHPDMIYSRKKSRVA